MKKALLTFAMLCTFTLGTQAQQIYNEVMRMQEEFKTIKYDKNKPMTERKTASFKWDVIEYMLYKSKDDNTFTEKQLGIQTYAMTEFVNLYFKRLSEAKNSTSKKEIAVARFKAASLNNALFGDTDYELCRAYVDNTNFLTPFSLDTDWVKALAEIRSKSWD